MALFESQLGSETAAVFEGVPPEDMRAQIEALAQMFDITQKMVVNPKWQSALVLPALHTQLSAGVAAMGQTMETLLELSSYIGDARARVSLTVAEIALATQVGGSGAAARAAAPDGVKVNAAMHEAAEQLGRSGAAREEVARLGWLAVAATKDETEAPALRAAASAAVTGEFGAQSRSRSSSTRRSSTHRKVRY